jgi:hypothetical protein
MLFPPFAKIFFRSFVSHLRPFGSSLARVAGTVLRLLILVLCPFQGGYIGSLHLLLAPARNGAILAGFGQRQRHQWR